MEIVFFDTETTGTEEEDRLIQLAYIRQELPEFKEVARFDSFFKPPLPVKIDAMAVHHITQKKVYDKPTFLESPSYEHVLNVFVSPETYAVAHNAEFDQKMLAKEGIAPANLICTLKVARFLDQQGQIPSHGLQYLRYYLQLDVEAQAHDALGDVTVLAALFERLYRKMYGHFGNPADTLAEMIRISKEPSLIPRFHFGKYRGQLFEEVVKSDAAYLKWLRDSETAKGPQADKDLLHTIAWHLNPQDRNKIPLSTV